MRATDYGTTNKEPVSIGTAPRFAALAAAVLAATAGCNRTDAGQGNITAGVLIDQTGMASLHERITNAVAAAAGRPMRGAGLAGVQGGAHFKILSTGTHEVLLPLPQLTEAQIPISYAITATPPETVTEYRLRQRDGSNVVVSVQLNGTPEQEVRLDWSAVVLFAARPGSPEAGPSEAYRHATACVESGAARVKTLADKLWPTNGEVRTYAANIQAHIRAMKQEKPPRSLDAVGILESGANWICTANANLATALLRSKNVPARSISVVPPTGQRLEMHRIVEYFDAGKWHQFDPSSLNRNIPLKPWQNILMARTTIADEDIAMKPRMGTSFGCPYGQEAELPGGGVTLWGQDFFWSIGKPLAQFEASDEALALARTEWNRFLESGKLSQSQMRAASATDAAGLLEALRTK